MAAETELERSGQATETRDPEAFSGLLKQSFKPRTERAATEVENAVQRWCSRRLPTPRWSRTMFSTRSRR